MALVKLNQLLLDLLVPVIAAVKHSSSLFALDSFRWQCLGQLVTQRSLILAHLGCFSLCTLVLIVECVVEPTSESSVEIVGVTNILGIFVLLAVRLELLHELLMLLLLLHIESMLALELTPINSSMLFSEIFEVDELLCFFLPVHDLLVDELSGRGLATLGDLLQAVELDHVLVAESFLFGDCIVSELLALVSLLLQFTQMWHLDQ